MCDFCYADPACVLPSCASTGSACACSLAGNSRCPTCGHECSPWFDGLGLAEGPDSIRDFLGGSGTESPGFDEYPATRAQILAACRAALEEMDTTADIPWLEQRLPEGTYQDAGEVFSVLTSFLLGSPLGASEWVRTLPLDAVAVGTRLIVPQDQMAFLVQGDGHVYDAFPPGEHTLSAQNAPLAAAASRRPAPGHSRWVFAAHPIFVSTRDLEGKVQVNGRSPSQSPIAVRASVRVWLNDPQKFARSPIGQSLQASLTIDRALGKAVTPAITTMIQGLDAQANLVNPPQTEAVLRSSLGAAGFGIRSVVLESTVIPFVMGAPMGPGVPVQFPPEVLARMPPEARAMMQARMNEAMQRRATMQTAGGPGPVAPPPTMPPSAYTPTRPAAPGAAVGGPRSCPACHQPVAPGVSFCGKCGTRLG